MIFNAILERAPIPAVRLNPDLPVDLERIINRALEKDRNLRYQHASDMRAELQRLKRDATSGVLSGSQTVPAASSAAQIPAAAPPASSDSGLAASRVARAEAVHPSGSSVVAAAKQHKFGLTAGVALLLVLIAAAGYGVYSMFRGGKAAIPFQNYTITQITDNAKSRFAAISPDGKYILSVVVDAGKESVWLRHVSTNSDTQIIAPAESFYIDFDFSPDGDHFYFRKARTIAGDYFDLYRAPALGGNPQIIVRDIDSNAAPSPDGKRIAYERANDPEVGKFQLFVANADGTDEKIIAVGPVSSASAYLAWSPDGKRIALSGKSGQAGPLRLMDVASGTIGDFPGTNTVQFAKTAWLPDGRGLLVQSQAGSIALNQYQISFVPYPSGQLHAITKDTNSYETLTLSADAKTLATVQAKRLYSLYSIPAAGKGANTPVPAMPQQQKGSLNFSWAGNDGFYLAEDNHLVRVSSSGGDATPLLNDASIRSVSACPDGRTLVLALIGQGGGTSTNIWRINADGTNLKQLTSGQFDDGPECSVDSKWVIYFQENA
ncbi:MAG: hypothetical protein WCC76_13075, partial [Candidatus Acidiferrales bacterium]